LRISSSITGTDIAGRFQASNQSEVAAGRLSQ
jgi:hypothetical protein